MGEYTESEKPAIDLFEALGYAYRDFSGQGIQNPIMETRLSDALKRINPWIDEVGISKILKSLSVVDADSLVEANQHIHQLLSSSSLSHQPNPQEPPKPIHLVDFHNPENNDWLVVNQIEYQGKDRKIIPDIMVYLNGLPVAMIEAKSPSRTSAIDEAINDLGYYQNQNEKLFWTNLLCVGVCGVDARYGAVEAPSMFYQKYKLETPKTGIENDQAWSFLTKFRGELDAVLEQDKVLYALFNQTALLDILRNFALFERSEGKLIKKLPRYQQMRAVNKAIDKIKTDNQGGVIWHTQGSGKSITMFYLAKKLRQAETGFDNPTVMILTDRTDLDIQISNTFRNAGADTLIQANSVKHLKELINDDYGKIITTTVQKFEDDMAQESESGGSAISDKQNVFVLIDEAHRTQYGDLAAYMRKALPHAKFFAFTGTPIDKEHKSTLGTFYGREYIDTYTIKQAVEDGATLPIYYDSAMPQLHVEEYLDSQFDFYFADASDEKKALLKQHAASLKNIMVDPDRIRDITKELVQHYYAKVARNGFKAMIVCFNREAAVNYKKELDSLKAKGVHSFNSKLVMSFQPKKDPQEYFDLAVPKDDIKEVVERFTLPLGDEAELSKSGKQQFDNTHFLIVSDMLLTGFDAPIVQAMYLDKPLKEHNLLQAIARVNRTHAGKNAGYIIDFCGITSRLKEALEIFGGELEPNEVMHNLDEEIPVLRMRHQKLLDFFKHISVDRINAADAYKNKAVLHLKSETRRDQFNELLKAFNQSMDIVLPHPAALDFSQDLKLFNEIKAQARNAYVEETLKVSEEESKQLKELLHEHLRSQGVGYLYQKPIPVFEQAFKEQLALIEDPEVREQTLEKRLQHTISESYEKDPVFYASLSERLDKVIKRLSEERAEQASLFDGMMSMVDEIAEHNRPKEGVSAEQVAIEGLLQHTYQVEDAPSVAQQVSEKLAPYITEISDWTTKEQVKKEMRKAVKPLLNGKVEKELIRPLQNEILDVVKKNQ